MVYSNRNINQSSKKTLENYQEIHKLTETISQALGLPEGFLKLMYVDPKTDARYHKENSSRSVLLNLARYKTNPDRFFWTFAVSRELAYIRRHQLGYAFINQLRAILMLASEAN